MNVFQDRVIPEPAQLAGYAWLIERFGLRVPLPSRLAGLSARHHRTESASWLLLTPRHAPDDTLRGHLTFALKWEGVELGVLGALFRAISSDDVAQVVRATPTGIYARRLWFLYEWLTGSTLDVPDVGKVRAVPALDPGQQLGVPRGEAVARQRVLNNLPGTSEFCPLVRRTPTLERFEALHLDAQARAVIGRTHTDVLARAAAFLLLSDSRSSFRIEGEQPSRERAVRWGQAIAQAGSQPLSRAELERLQRLVIGDARFVRLGMRDAGGFVGVHDRETQEPIPDHISARPDDLASLLRGIVAYDQRAVQGGLDPVVAAASEAFGFVYVHPFEDGNGRIHRWLIHHVLSAAGYSPPGVVFPVSAAILRHLDAYREVLESYSRPLLLLIDWRPTLQGNVDVLNATADFYRYFDATAHAEFLYARVEETVTRDLPDEVAYLESYDRFAAAVQGIVDMPARHVDLLHRFLRQHDGRLSARARSREFASLTPAEVERIEELYRQHAPVAHDAAARAGGVDDGERDGSAPGG